MSLGPYEIAIERDLRVPLDDGVELLAELIWAAGSVAPDLTVPARIELSHDGPQRSRVELPIWS